MASVDRRSPLGATFSPENHALETIERVLAQALGRNLATLPVFSPRNVTALAHEAAARLREGA